MESKRCFFFSWLDLDWFKLGVSSLCFFWLVYFKGFFAFKSKDYDFGGFQEVGYQPSAVFVEQILSKSDGIIWDVSYLFWAYRMAWYAL